MRSENINELAKALAAAQGEFQNAAMDRVNPHYKSKYTTLAAVLDVCRAPLAKNGLAVTQSVTWNEGKYVVTSALIHVSGQYIESHCPLILTQSSMQALGSAITYAKRYALMAMLGIASADEDDDGNAARPTESGKQAPVSEPRSESPYISEAQLKRLFALQKNAGVSDAEMKEIGAKFGITTRKEIPKGNVYDNICFILENWNGQGTA